MCVTFDMAHPVLPQSMKALARAFEGVGGSLPLQAGRASNRLVSVLVFAESELHIRKLLHISRKMVL
jgi:hypothetical protein